MTVRSLHAVVSIKRHNQAHQSSPCIYSDRDSAKIAYTHTHISNHSISVVKEILLTPLETVQLGHKGAIASTTHTQTIVPSSH